MRSVSCLYCWQGGRHWPPTYTIDFALLYITVWTLHKILDTTPCGVDTQITNAAGVRHMSARYMLTGTDCAGKAAHIYVENNGWFDESVQREPGPFHTVPTFYTDSAALAPYLHRNQFIGEGSGEEDGLHIKYYEIEHGET